MQGPLEAGDFAHAQNIPHETYQRPSRLIGGKSWSNSDVHAGGGASGGMACALCGGWLAGAGLGRGSSVAGSDSSPRPGNGKSWSDPHGTRLSPKRAESGCVARKSEPRPVPENRPPNTVNLRGGAGCGAGGSRPVFGRAAAGMRPTAPASPCQPQSVERVQACALAGCALQAHADAKKPQGPKALGFGALLIWLEALALLVGRTGALGRGLGLTRCCAVAAL